MLWQVEEFHGPTPASLQGLLAIRIWMVALIISVVCWNVNAVARTSVTRQEIGIEERLQAEKRLWELGYWAGPIDGTFDSASRHALVAFQKVEGRARTGNLTGTELKALQSATRPRARYERFAHIEIDVTRQQSVSQPLLQIPRRIANDPIMLTTTADI